MFTEDNPFKSLISHSPGLESVIRTAQIVASADITVLIYGETGTGKELLSQAIHQASPRANNDIIVVNCAALSETLIESQLFGHQKGSFTGAIADSKGYIEAAHQGTLFLDEIAELSMKGQAALLRFLESGECQIVGSTETKQINARVIAATHRNLQQMVDDGSFRHDLFYRLNAVTLELPPIRKRLGDISLLLSYYTKLYASKQKKQILNFDKTAIKRLQQHDWPGNVRELRNLSARLVTLKDETKTISEIDISEELAVQACSIDASLFELPEEGINLEELEIDLIKQALKKSDGNKSKAAKMLGISRDAFLYRLKKHNL